MEARSHMTNPTHWTAEQDQLLRDNWHLGFVVCEKLLPGRSRNALTIRAHKLRMATGKGPRTYRRNIDPPTPDEIKRDAAAIRATWGILVRSDA
jgi:hypothetical protein